MTPTAVPDHILVFVPGYMGSTLREPQSGRSVWLDFSSLPLNPLQWEGWLDHWLATMTYPSPLEPAGIVDSVVLVPPLVKLEQYRRLFEAMAQIGYRTDGNEREVNFYPFPYDWRQDNRVSARQLGQAIERWRSLHPGAQVWILAHSNGGVVARWYVEKEGGKDVVHRMFLMGSPYDGTPKAMRIAFNGADMLARPGLNPFNISQRTRDLFRSFPSLYQLFPVGAPFLRDAEQHELSAFDANAWLTDDRQRAYLEDGRRFTEALGDAASVETLCFFGRRKPTLTAGIVHTRPHGRWERIEWITTEAGDGTIPERSAAHPRAAGRYPFAVGHGDIYINPAVLEFMRWELKDKYEGVAKEIVATETMTVDFAPERDAYREGETIRLRARVTAPTGEPLDGATITVRMTWEQPLPGDPPPVTLPRDAVVALTPSSAGTGEYAGELYAPGQNGYYRLIAHVEHPGTGQAQASELIAAETTRG